MNEIDGLDAEGGVVLMFAGLLFSSLPFSFDMSSRDLFGCLGYIMMALIKLWIQVERWGSSVRSKMSFHQALDLFFKLNETMAGCTRDILRQRIALIRLAKSLGSFQLSLSKRARSSNNAQDYLAFLSRSLPLAD
nr:hypothetical protein [Tanacetum cinerariifolium]